MAPLSTSMHVPQAFVSSGKVVLVFEINRLPFFDLQVIFYGQMASAFCSKVLIAKYQPVINL